ncbi:trans-aconitate methyltransferase 1 [Gnomoniopsis smithogilvyi]|uniref:Trans-aconitate methyltransferase 1 n=1 Tax=Gnomoniopsis smithogilvyi TaxID=1191159 RepID=A0A9W9CUE3_9PEZI|nr:trans-aconitate methyltransferase 1 [Gnomoniopsis smithogilvyi]
MATFLKQSFQHKQYAAFRPSYPKELYNTILNYHNANAGRQRLALDLGTGHGLVARQLAPRFNRIVGTDPSPGMVKQAQHLTANSPSMAYTRVSFRQGYAEETPFLEDHSVDLVTAGQAAHWFDYPRLWPELARLMRPGGSTLAFFGYKDHVLPSFPRASEIIQHYAYNVDPELLGSYWQQPGRSIVQDKLRKVQPPTEEWEDIQRVEYEPNTAKGPGGGQGTPFMKAKMTLGAMEEYIRTWSSFHTWQRKFPNRERRGIDGKGKGDVVDELMDAVRDAEPALRGDGSATGWKDIEVDVEWGSALLLARRK